MMGPRSRELAGVSMSFMGSDMIIGYIDRFQVRRGDIYLQLIQLHRKVPGDSFLRLHNFDFNAVLSAVFGPS
jgi:hypothetical protein